MRLFIVGCISVLVLLTPQFVCGQNIVTIAGNGTNGYFGDNSLAINARISRANAVSIDRIGNVYIPDCQNNRIRKIDIVTGIISTVVGNGIAGYNGDNILAINAQINGPSCNIAFDSAGNYYFGDFNNNRIRKVDITTGMISTIAGTGTPGYNGDSIIATTAQLYHPEGVVIDNNGNVYFADNANHRIRKINTITGLITTIAGNGNGGYNGDSILATSASLKFPTNIVLDTNQNIIIADWQNNRIRKVNITTGLISTIAGNGNGAYNGDNILATSASISTPATVEFDGMWNLYVGSEFGYRIRKIDANTGIITTVVGDGTSGYNGDGIFAINAKLNSPGVGEIDKCGNLYIADAGNYRIRMVWFNADTLTYAAIAIMPNDTVTTGTQVTATATISNGYAVGYQWIKNGVATGTTTSSYTYTPTNGDSLYCIVTARACTGRTYTDTTQVVHITVTGDAGITNTTNHITYTYPNPVRNVLYVATIEAQSYVLHNLMGVTMLRGTISKNYSIDMRAIPVGTYLLQLTKQTGQREVVRVVKE